MDITMLLNVSILFDYIRRLSSTLNLMSIVAFLCFMTGTGMIFWYILRILIYKIRKYKFLTDKSKASKLTDLTKWLTKKPFFEVLLNITASRISMFTDYSYNRNVEISTVILVSILSFTSLCFVIFINQPRVVWYVLLTYLFLIMLFFGLILHVLNVSVRLRFTAKLPETFKLLNSRYISHGNILKAISQSIELDDFDRVVKKVMRTIRDVLIKNDMNEIDNTLSMIEKNYNNQFLTLLLCLIKHAHYKGGEKVIKRQFENATEEILFDIENQKDLASTTRMYILMAIVMPLSIIGIERFNTASLGDASLLFYQSPSGYGIKLAVIIAVIIYIGYMLFLERSV